MIQEECNLYNLYNLYNIVRDENKSELLWMRDGVRVICQEGQSEIEFAALSYTKNLKKKNEMKLK